MKTTIITILITLGLVGGGFFLLKGGGDTKDVAPTANSSIVDGKQIVTINVKGGYNPKVSSAKAGMPTIVRFVTNNTFDCSSAMRIPSLNISKALPPTGSTDIEIGTSTAGTLQGVCSMGMYKFEIIFE